MFDKVLAYDFDVLVGGHLGFPGTRRDVEVARDYTFDVYHTVKRIHDGTDQANVVAQAAATIRVGQQDGFVPQPPRPDNGRVRPGDRELLRQAGECRRLRPQPLSHRADLCTLGRLKEDAHEPTTFVGADASSAALCLLASHRLRRMGRRSPLS
jgi:hypothetical protein